MNAEIKEKIEKSTTRNLVSAILKDEYSGEEKEYAISYVEKRFEGIAKSLQKLSKLEKEAAKVPEGISAESVLAEAEKTIDVLGEKLTQVTKEKEELQVNFDKVFAELKEKVATINKLQEELENVSKDENLEALLQEEQQKVLDAQAEIVQRDETIALLQSKMKTPTSESSTNASGFFTELYGILPEIVSLKLLLHKENNEAIVTAFPEPKVGDSEFTSSLPPITFKGSPEELDNEFVQTLLVAMKHVAKVSTEIADYEKAVDLAKTKSKMEKDKKDKAKSEEDKLSKQLEDLIKEEKFDEALPIADKLRTINSKKYSSKYEEVKEKTSGTLF